VFTTSLGVTVCGGKVGAEGTMCVKAIANEEEGHCGSSVHGQVCAVYPNEGGPEEGLVFIHAPGTADHVLVNKWMQAKRLEPHLREFHTKPRTVVEWEMVL
jgi:hypothetical protein